MATIKSYTDINQAKVLSKILPLESADMFCADVFNKEKETHSYNFHILSTWGCNTFEELKDRENKFVCFIPVWSLAALLNILHSKAKNIPSLSGGGYKDGKYISDWCLDYEFENGDYQKTFADNPIDACVAMLEKLHKLNLL